MNLKSATIIKCPNCGAQYLPSEIFFPGDLTGKQINIVKDTEGKILHFDEEDACQEQEYVCDCCNSTFKVRASVSYVVSPCPEHDFDEDYVVKIGK